MERFTAIVLVYFKLLVFYSGTFCLFQQQQLHLLQQLNLYQSYRSYLDYHLALELLL